MENNIKISIEGGYIDHPDILITPEEANNLKPGEVTIHKLAEMVKEYINIH